MSQKNKEIVKKLLFTLVLSLAIHMFVKNLFSKTILLKSQYHSRLMVFQLEDIVRMSCSPCGSRFEKLAQHRKCNFSY